MSSLSLLSNNRLKLIAMAAMLVDHIGMLLFPHEPLFRIVGRLSMPLFAYMIAEGCTHTRHRTRYLLSVAGLAVPCQLAYTLTTGSWYQNILVTFSLSIAVIFSLDRAFETRSPAAVLTAEAVCGGVLIVTLGLPLAIKSFDVDYGLFGVLLPVAVYYAPQKPQKLAAALLILTALASCSSPIQWYALLAVPLLALYNGQRGRANLKYAFYLFYPLHLLCLELLRLWLR